MTSQSGDVVERATIRIQLEVNPMIRFQGQKVENGWIELPEGTSVASLLRIVGIDLKQAQITAIVNGRVVSLDSICSDGDRVALLPQIGGG